VVDIGAYKGDFLCKRAALEPTKNFYGFEPITEFFATAAKLFEDSQNVFIYNFGLAASDEITNFWLNDDATGKSESVGKQVQVCLKDISNEPVFLTPLSLVVCNIEGGEYALINRLVEKSLICNIEVLLLQFHNVDEWSANKMAETRELLSRTHRPEFKFDFIWDAWIRKDLSIT